MAREIPTQRLQGLAPETRGLTAVEVAERRQRYGPNDILEVTGNPWLELARDTLKDPMIWFLVATSIAYAVLGSIAESLTLLLAILPLIGMDAFLHRRTQASTQSLSRQLAQYARVIRNAEILQVPAVDLVPGDLAVIGVGESFPADGVIIRGEDLQADESSLTGESQPVRKRPLEHISHQTNRPVPGDHWGFAGTRLLTGEALMRVIYTGQETLYGEIVVSATHGEKTRTPLQVAISGLVSLLLASAGVLCLILAGVRLRQGHHWVDALISAATLAVAALPEEFPVVFTVFLGVGVYRLAKRKALVRRAVSVENMGRITCICTDKTGTVTLGQLRLEHFVPAQGVSPQRLLQLAGLACRRETGDPLDLAILDRIEADGIAALENRAIATYPYTEQRRRETTVINEAGHFLAASKGSPETLLPMSNLSPSERMFWAQQVEALAEGGHKVLACLWWDLGFAYAGGEPDRGGQWAGLLAFEDPLREGVTEAVRHCREAGLRIMMVTGDHPTTAKGIAREMGLGGGKPGVLSGDELAERLDQKYPDPLAGIDVVARTLPTQKLSLVRALQTQGEIVAVTGDGVNDVPALQAADIGIAMGERGTRSAREVASIVLLDDNFRSIVQAIAEGRQLFRNLQLSFQYLLMIHIPLIVTATFIPLTGHPLLFLPIHIVWLETIIHPTALLVFQELPSKGRLEPVRRTKARFFSAREWALIAAVGTLITLLILWSYDRSLMPGRNVEHARAMAMAALTCASAVITASLSGLRTASAWVITVLTLLLSLALIQTPMLAHWLHLQPLHPDDLGIALVGSSAAILMPLALLENPWIKRRRQRYKRFLNS